MKKELMNVINSEDGTFKLNKISYLRRWTKDALGNDVDELTLEFNNINNVCYSIADRKIKSRDYEGIIEECEEITKRFFEEVSRKICSDLRAGYNIYL